MIAIKQDTPIEEADLPLLKKAGLDKIDKVYLKFFSVIGGGNKIVEEEYRAGSVVNKREGQLDAYNISDQVQPFLPTPQPNSNFLMGNWTNGLKKEEVEYLQLRYGLPIYKEDTYIFVPNNRPYNLANLQDHAEYNILVNVPNIKHDKSTCVAGPDAFYWEKPQDELAAKRDKIKRYQEISAYMSGAKSLATSDKVLHLELYCHIYNVLYRPEMLQEELALEFDGVCMDNQDRALKVIKLFEAGDGLYRNYIYRLIANGLMEKREKEREFYVRVNNEWQYAGEDWAAALRYLKKPENAALLAKAQAINTIKLTHKTIPTLHAIKSEFTEGLITREQLKRAEEEGSEFDIDKGEDAGVAVGAVSTTGWSKAKVQKLGIVECDQLFAALVTKGVVTAEEQAAYEGLKAVTEKRINIISKLNL